MKIKFNKQENLNTIKMKLLINNDERIFQVKYSYGKSFFCNLHHMNECINELQLSEGYFKIYHFYNNSPKLVSKKYLKEMFESHRIEQNFYY